MLDKGCFLVMVVRRLHATQTRPPPTVSLWLSAKPHAAPIVFRAPGVSNLHSILCGIGNGSLLTPLLFFTTLFNSIIFN